MRNSRSILVSVSLLAITACGASSNSAPVVYGTEPSTGRIYNSPAEAYLGRPSVQPPASIQTDPRTRIVAQSNTAFTQQTYGNAPTAQRQGVRIYNAPPPAPLNENTQPVRLISQPVPVQSASLAPVAGAPIAGTPVHLSHASQVEAQPPVYRGLPPAPTYRNTPSAIDVAATPARQPLTGGGSVIVQPGDTVYAIARRSGYAPNDIIAVNNMRAPYALSVGQRLLLPVAGLSNGTLPQDNFVNDPYRTPTARNDVSRTISYVEPQNVLPVTSQAAPIVSGEVIARDTLYTVVTGDTLYSIARRNGISVSSIAAANRMSAPYALNIGQQLLLPAVPIKQVAQATPAPRRSIQPASVKPEPSRALGTLAREASFKKTSPVKAATQFDWPVRGAVISNFGTGGLGRQNEGINISAPQGATIRAAAAGEVIYRGAELDGYGNLLLIKHDGGYITAYAHNDVILVRKGQKVSKGAIIAKVGKTGAVNEPQLHFELRHNERPLDPLQYLASN